MTLGRKIKDKVLEWEPANIIGKQHKEYGTSVFRDIDIRVLLVVAFITIVALAVAKRWYVPCAFFVAIFFITLRTTPSRKSYVIKLSYPFLVATFIFVIQSYTYGSTQVFTVLFPVYAEGISSGWLIFNRVLASVSILLLLVESASPTELIESLVWFKVPVEMRTMMSLMARYTSVLAEEFATMFNAQKARLGYSATLSWIKKLRNIAIIGGMLLVRSYDRSNTVTMSMTARGYTPAADVVRTFVRFSRRDYIFAALSLTFITSVVLIGGA
jgi:cobalt/nickel transport system permease protein